MPFCFSLLNNKPEKYLYARFEKGSRYYVIRLEQDLFGDWIISQINGRIKSRLGQTRTLAFQNFQDAFEQFLLIATVRYQRNYQTAGWMSTDVIFHYLVFAVTITNDDKIHSTPTKRPRKPPSILAIKPPKPIAPSLQQMGFDF